MLTNKFFLGTVTTIFLVSNLALAAKQKVEATSFDASFNADEKSVTVSFTFENKTSKPMYMTDDGSPEVKSVRFEPTETCVLVSKLKKPDAGQPEIRRRLPIAVQEDTELLLGEHVQRRQMVRRGRLLFRRQLDVIIRNRD